MNGVKSLAHSAVIRALPRAAGVRASTAAATATTKRYVECASRLGTARGISSATRPLHLPERSSFQATYYQDHASFAASFAVPAVVDELDPRNFGYRVVDHALPNDSHLEEDYDLYSLHMSPTQVTCTSYYVDVLGEELPQLPAAGNATGEEGSLQSRGDAAEDFGGIDDESSPSSPVTDEDGEG
jgi:hypothetical protein